MSNLRKKFETEVKKKFKGSELLFETKNSKYIKWLEKKVESNNNN